MNRIGDNNLLADTLSLIQLARETARQRGNKAQADRLGPVADNLHTAVTNEQSRVKSTTTVNKPSALEQSSQIVQERQNGPAASLGIMGQSDFRTLLQASQQSSSNSSSSLSSSMERNQIISAMSSGGMSEVDIARQMGMTRDEVRMVINLNNMSTNFRR
jgi:actin-related protein